MCLIRICRKQRGYGVVLSPAPYGQIEHKSPEPPTGITVGSKEDGIEYACAAGVTKFDSLPNDSIQLTVPAATYAVFAHDGHVTQLRETYEAIWNDWFPKSGKTPAEAPTLERHKDTALPTSLRLKLVFC